jgi:hypothetical protein
MQTCVAKREGKLIDARFVRPLSDGERSKLEGHLVACGWCRERYRKLQLADRVTAFGAAAELDVPAPIEVERMARDLGLLDPEKPKRAWFDLRIAGAVVAVAFAVVLFVRPSDDLVERGAAPAAVTFSAYAGGEGAWRLLEPGAQVAASEHLKLRASGEANGGVEVLLVGADGRVEHVHLLAPVSSLVPGAIALEGLPTGKLTAYLIAAKSFDPALARRLAAARAPAKELASALGGASVERIDLEVR